MSTTANLHAYLVNLTPHTVHIYHPGKSIATDDLLVPHDMVRDADGRVIGCRGFSRPAR